jgi:asparagine synthase (glutamine-hydrolysing)
MRGIAGVVSNDETDEMGQRLRKMLEVMLHRGPDGAGFVIGGDLERKFESDGLNFEDKKGKVTIGHMKLAITGGTSGLQPFQSKDEKLSLRHNGEIYNYRELRKNYVSNQITQHKRSVSNDTHPNAALRDFFHA